MVSVTSASYYITSASRYHPRYQSRSSMYISGLIPRNFAEMVETVPIDFSYNGNTMYYSVLYRNGVGQNIFYDAYQIKRNGA